ncbi:unnamed protein product, partial [Rotaria sp. Silwood2]
ELFVPLDTKQVNWCHCLATVDGKRHIGHSRYYVLVDIIRRVIQFYFGFQVSFFMNIMDIDDEIVKRAREKHLIQNYIDDGSIMIEKIIEDCQLALKHVKDIRSHKTDKDEQEMYDRQISTVEVLLQNIDTLSDVEIKRQKLFDDCWDILSSYLDFNYSYTTNPLDNEVFLKLARDYEIEFHKDMVRLNILPQHALTHVSEYVPQIVTFIEKLINKGYAYESNLSVYLDKMKLSKQHSDAKLKQDQLTHVAALSQDKQASTTAKGTNKEKKYESDFVLWKKSKPGEPVWQSPWGPGRPGSHIGCIAVARTVLGSQFDIHTSDIDLKFQYHDNKIPQSEAYFDPASWIIHFLHSVHLTIAGCKMSKSESSIVTIEKALHKYGARNIRLLFLLHSWSTTVYYTDDEIKKASNYERTLNDFFVNVKTHLFSIRDSNNSNADTKFNERDLIINEHFSTAEKQIHLALCDSIDTPRAMENIRQLILKTNIYISKEKAAVNCFLLRKIAAYITRLITIFGLNDCATSVDDIGFSQTTKQQASTENVEKTVIPCVNEFASFNNGVRTQATADKNEEIVTFGDNVTFKVKVLSKSCIRLSEQNGTKKATINYGPPDVLQRECEQASLDKKSKQEKE